MLKYLDIKVGHDWSDLAAAAAAAGKKKKKKKKGKILSKSLTLYKVTQNG